MSRQLEAKREERQRREDQALLLAVDSDLVAGVERSGAVFYGLALSYDGAGWLAVVKGELAGKRQVAFVGGASLASVLIKVGVAGAEDKLVWREDRYSKG